ncbi:MAG: helix-turn-helix domain-containing protein [Acidimicrobiales bacterium]
MATGSGQTRAVLLDTAERLFSENGIHAVSLRQIRLAAGQGNAAAVQYHFGDKAGVLQALADRHVPRLAAVQQALVDDLGSTPSLRDRVDALVRPFAIYVTLGPSERAWIRIVDELLADPQVSVASVEAGSSDVVVGVGTDLHAELSDRLPADLAADRIWAASVFAIRLCAARARALDDPRSTRSLPTDDVFATELVDMATGALTAPSHASQPTA